MQRALVRLIALLAAIILGCASLVGQPGDDSAAETLPDVLDRSGFEPAEAPRDRASVMFHAEDALEASGVGLRIFVFEMGQADSMLVIGPPPENLTLLIDVGHPGPGVKYEEANHDYVKRRVVEITGQPAVDFLVVTHFHSDHIGQAKGKCKGRNRRQSTGLFALLEEGDFRVGELFDPGDTGKKYKIRRGCPQLDLIRLAPQWETRKVIGARNALAFGTQSIDLGGDAKIEILAFDGRVHIGDAGALDRAEKTTSGTLYKSDARASENDFSVALEISLGDFEMFTAGDLTGASGDGPYGTHSKRRFRSDKPATVYTNVESHMVAHWGSSGRESDVEVYRSNHHGSGHSSTTDLANALEPEVVIYSTGGGYNHPDPDTVDRFAQMGATQYVTSGVNEKAWRNRVPPDIVGEIEIIVAADGSKYWLNGEEFEAFSDAEEQ